MERISEENSKILKRISLLSDSVALNQKLNELDDNPILHKLFEGLEDADNLQEITNEIQKRMTAIRKECDEVMRDLRETQADIINYLLKTKKQKIAEEKKPHQGMCFLSPYRQHYSMQSNSLSSQVNHSALKQMQLKLGDSGMTPKISIKDYKASPLVKKPRMKVVPFDLSDFDVHITPKQFESIPKYMRGRVSFDEVQHFLEHIVVPCFNEKYKLLHRTRPAVQNSKDFELWKIYHSQISYVQGRNFITAGDLSRKIQKMIDKKTQNFLIMIRHMGILEEHHIPTTTCYIWKAT